MLQLGKVSSQRLIKLEWEEKLLIKIREFILIIDYIQRFAEDLVLEGSSASSQKHIMCEYPPVSARIANDLVLFGSS